MRPPHLYSSRRRPLTQPARTHRRPLSHLFPNAPADALDLMTKLLQFNPERRLSADETLAHPYLAQFHNPGGE